MKRLTNQTERETAQREIAVLLATHGEWFCAEEGGHIAPATVRTGEWEVRVSAGGIHFSFWSDVGLRLWRVAAWEWTGERLVMEATRRAGAEHAMLELVPRASAQIGLAVLRAARLAACERLAQLACDTLPPGAQIARVRLSAGARRCEPGRYARIVLRRGRELIAVTGPVVDVGKQEAEAVVVSALLWRSRLQQRARKERVTELWLLVSPELREGVWQRLALLRKEVRRDLRLYEIDKEWHGLELVPLSNLDELLASRPRAPNSPREELSEVARRIVALSPAEIDVVRARHGETLRYHGLPFVRVRRVADETHVWFGTGKGTERRLLDERSWPQLAKLIDELAAHRRADTPDARHALYRALPEAWLESLLRRDITRLDPGLVVSPLHAQFRLSRDARGAGSRPVDLLALRRDGRLVVIELKVSEDVALALQAADYWRQIETHRRLGHIAQAKLFGELKIQDEPPLVYLVAPWLRFHRTFHTLARLLAPEIEMYRFDLNEGWRAGVRVVRRTQVD